MKYLLVILLTISSTINVNGQNLVPNGNFEDYTTCPPRSADMTYCTGWANYVLSPDFFHSCAAGTEVAVPANYRGLQMPADGDGYAGIAIYGTNSTSIEGFRRNIIPLEAGQYYEVSMSVSLADTCYAAINGLGVYFYINDKDLILSSEVLAKPAQVVFEDLITDKINWVRLTGRFKADSAYTKMAVSRFTPQSQQVSLLKPGSQSAFYYIDSIVVKKLPTFTVTYNDTSFCDGDSIIVSYKTVVPVNASTTFSLELSDMNGSFTTPYIIATQPADSTGVFRGIIPTCGTGSGYKLRIVSANPADTFYADNTTFDISERVKPEILGNTEICEGDALQLTANAATPVSFFRWFAPGISVNGSSLQINNITMLHKGKYILEANNNGCIATDTTDIIVKPKPAVPDVSSNSPVVAGKALNLLLKNYTAGVIYAWQGPAGFSSSLPNPVINNVSKQNQGFYSVTASLDGCTSENQLVAIVENIETPATKVFVVYPNINNGDFWVTASVDYDQSVQLRVSNIAGQEVYRASAQTHNKTLNANIALSNSISSGVYILRLVLDGKAKDIKISVGRQ